LAVDAANVATTDGKAQQAEVTELVKELEAIGQRTSLAGRKVLDNYTGENALTFHVGSGAGETPKRAIQLHVLDGVRNLGRMFAEVANIQLDDDPDRAITILDAAIAEISEKRSVLGASQNRLEHTIANLSVAVENLSASESRIRDTDMAEEMVAFTR